MSPHEITQGRQKGCEDIGGRFSDSRWECEWLSFSILTCPSCDVSDRLSLHQQMPVLAAITTYQHHDRNRITLDSTSERTHAFKLVSDDASRNSCRADFVVSPALTHFFQGKQAVVYQGVLFRYVFYYLNCHKHANLCFSFGGTPCREFAEMITEKILQTYAGTLNPERRLI